MTATFGDDKAQAALQEAKNRGEFIELSELPDWYIDDLVNRFVIMETVAEDFDDEAELEIARRNLRELYAELDRRKSAQENK